MGSKSIPRMGGGEPLQAQGNAVTAKVFPTWVGVNLKEVSDNSERPDFPTRVGARNEPIKCYRHRENFSSGNDRESQASHHKPNPRW